MTRRDLVHPLGLVDLERPGTGRGTRTVAAVALHRRRQDGTWAVAPLLSRLLLAHGCAAARMSEGLLHIAPPFIATDGDLDIFAERVVEVVDDVTPEIAAL